jgi:hypothetical protein
MRRPPPQSRLVVLDQLGLLIRCAGPAKLPLGAEQGFGRHHDLLQGDGQAAFKV